MKVLIGDDHQLFRTGLGLQLQSLDDAVELVDAGTFTEVLEIVATEAGIDLALIDLGMPGMAWQEALGILHKNHPDLPVVIVSASDDTRDIVKALDLGAAGYIPKTSSSAIMINALRLVLAGGTYLPAEAVGRLETGQKQTPDQQSEAGVRSTILTPRQHDVLALMAEGQSNKEIAARLDLSDGTVKSHISAILRALDAANRTKAILNAIRLGILPPS